jgi:hypothetical protein
MKFLARDARERTAWARRYLSRLTVVWQFDTAAGVRYASGYPPAGPDLIAHSLQLRAEGPGFGSVGRSHRAVQGGLPAALDWDEGLLGDGALEYQARLERKLRTLIERADAW